MPEHTDQRSSGTSERTRARQLRNVLRQLDQQERSERMDEAAIPAYSHRNPVIARLFWKRLQLVSTRVARLQPVGAALDIGCGSGVMLPRLSEAASTVVGIDPDLTACRRFSALVPLPPSVTLVETTLESFAGTHAGPRFDLIIALDSLEHVPDLEAALDAADTLLAAGGTLIVSGPTESWVYRLGRKVAGKRFSGHYHERGVAEIRERMAERWTITDVRLLPRALPLFEIISAKKA